MSGWGQNSLYTEGVGVGGNAEEIDAKPDIGIQMSGVGGEADVARAWSER
jgi:hypothetical protein